MRFGINLPGPFVVTSGGRHKRKRPSGDDGGDSGDGIFIVLGIAIALSILWWPLGIIWLVLATAACLWSLSR